MSRLLRGFVIIFVTSIQALIVSNVFFPRKYNHNDQSNMGPTRLGRGSTQLQSFGKSTRLEAFAQKAPLLFVPPLQQVLPQFTYFYLRTELKISELALSKFVVKYPSLMYLNVERNLKPTIAVLVEFGFRMDEIRYIVENFPTILAINHEWSLPEKLLSLQKMYSLSRRGLVSMVVNNPIILCFSVNRNLESASFFIDVGFSEKEIRTIIERCSRLTSANPGVLRACWNMLTEVYGFPDAGAKAICIRSPSVLEKNALMVSKERIRFFCQDLLMPPPFEDLKRVIRRMPQILYCNMEYYLRPNLDILKRRLDMTSEDLLPILNKHPHLLVYHPVSLERAILQCLFTLGGQRPEDTVDNENFDSLYSSSGILESTRVYIEAGPRANQIFSMTHIAPSDDAIEEGDSTVAVNFDVDDIVGLTTSIKEHDEGECLEPSNATDDPLGAGLDEVDDFFLFPSTICDSVGSRHQLISEEILVERLGWLHRLDLLSDIPVANSKIMTAEDATVEREVIKVVANDACVLAIEDTDIRRIVTDLPWVLSYRTERTRMILMTLAVTLGMSKSEVTRIVWLYPRLLSSSPFGKIRRVVRLLACVSLDFIPRVFDSSVSGHTQPRKSLSKSKNSYASVCHDEEEVGRAFYAEVVRALRLDVNIPADVIKAVAFTANFMQRRKNPIRSMIRMVLLRFPHVVGFTLERLRSRFAELYDPNIIPSNVLNELRWDTDILQFIRRSKDEQARWLSKRGAAAISQEVSGALNMSSSTDIPATELVASAAQSAVKRHRKAKASENIELEEHARKSKSSKSTAVRRVSSLSLGRPVSMDILSNYESGDILFDEMSQNDDNGSDAELSKKVKQRHRRNNVIQAPWQSGVENSTLMETPSAVGSGNDEEYHIHVSDLMERLQRASDAGSDDYEEGDVLLLGLDHANNEDSGAYPSIEMKLVFDDDGKPSVIEAGTTPATDTSTAPTHNIRALNKRQRRPRQQAAAAAV